MNSCAIDSLVNYLSLVPFGFDWIAKLDRYTGGQYFTRLYFKANSLGYDQHDDIISIQELSNEINPRIKGAFGYRREDMMVLGDVLYDVFGMEAFSGIDINRDYVAIINVNNSHFLVKIKIGDVVTYIDDVDVSGGRTYYNEQFVTGTNFEEYDNTFDLLTNRSEDICNGAFYCVEESNFESTPSVSAYTPQKNNTTSSTCTTQKNNKTTTQTNDFFGFGYILPDDYSFDQGFGGGYSSMF